MPELAGRSCDRARARHRETGAVAPLSSAATVRLSRATLVALKAVSLVPFREATVVATNPEHAATVTALDAAALRLAQQRLERASRTPRVGEELAV